MYHKMMANAKQLLTKQFNKVNSKIMLSKMKWNQIKFI